MTTMQASHPTCPTCMDHHAPTVARCQRYNGWPNYETWAVQLWLSNEEPSYRYWTKRAQEVWDEAAPGKYSWQTREEMAREALAGEIREEHEHDAEVRVGGASIFSDLLGAALSEVDWREIARHW